MSATPLLLVGLGNPGAQYANTRHNLGVMLLDALADKHRFPAWQKKFDGQFTQGTVNGQKLLLLKPHTFMNLSGRSVLPAVSFYKLKPAQVLVLHDELDLPFLGTKTKKGGGDAGHNGLKSITQAIGAEYHRLRLGIAHPRDTSVPQQPVADYVLQPFSPAQAATLSEKLPTLVQSLEALLPTLA